VAHLGSAQVAGNAQIIQLNASHWHFLSTGGSGATIAPFPRATSPPARETHNENEIILCEQT
jgi:hypothetical protein